MQGRSRCIIRLGGEAAGAGAGAINERPMAERVRRGREVELHILQRLQESGMRLTPPTHAEDAYAKIDAWWHTTDASGGETRKGVQVKYRETGDDILFEVYKDWDRSIVGRDLAGTADYYMTVDRRGTGYLVPVKALKDKVYAALEAIERDGWTFPDRQHYVDRDAGIDIKIREDAYHGQQKCMAYVRPRSLPIVRQWRGIL